MGAKMGDQIRCLGRNLPLFPPGVRGDFRWSSTMFCRTCQRRARSSTTLTGRCWSWCLRQQTSGLAAATRTSLLPPWRNWSASSPVRILHSLRAGAFFAQGHSAQTRVACVPENHFMEGFSVCDSVWSTGDIRHLPAGRDSLCLHGCILIDCKMMVDPICPSPVAFCCR